MNNLTPVEYSEVAFDERYNELKNYSIAVPKDPVSLGFNGLSELLSRIQSYKDRLNELLSEATLMKTKAEVIAESARYEYETRLDLLLSTDEEIKNLPSDRIRVARANVVLREQRDRAKNSELTASLVQTYYKTVAMYHKNIESANKNIVEQCQLYKRSNPPVDSQPFQGKTPVRSSV